MVNQNENQVVFQNEKIIDSPEKELRFVQSKIIENTPNFKERLDQVQDKYVSQEIENYKKINDKIISPEFKIPDNDAQGISLNLAPEQHDIIMSELLYILQEKGIASALSVVEKMKKPHIDDDFHRFLVQYIKTTDPIKGFDPQKPKFKGIRMALFEISLPKQQKEEENKSLKELLSSMEQFYAGMLSIADEKNKNYFSIEIATSAKEESLRFYCAIPDDKKELFEKHLISIFPKARIREQNNDYNIFSEGNANIALDVSLEKQDGFPIKTYDTFDYDPLNVLLNSFSKVGKGEGAAIQILISPNSDGILKKIKKALEKIKKGTKPSDALEFSFGIGGIFLDVIRTLLFGSSSKEDPQNIDQTAIQKIETKISSPIIKTNIRILTSALNKERAMDIAEGIKSSFNQFEDTLSNKFKFTLNSQRDFRKDAHNFSYRIFNEKEKIYLNTKELTSIVHIPVSSVSSIDSLERSRSSTAPAPFNTPTDGIILGVNKHKGLEREIKMLPSDRLRHMYVIGQTGTGKTTLLKNMIVQDIKNGEGVCMIDPHGSDIQDILANIPESRWGDVIYFDPSYTARPMGLNMLEYDINFPEQKTFVVNEMLSIFNKLFDMKVAGGPMFEQYFRNAVMLVIDHPESGNTLLEVSRVLADRAFRRKKLDNCKNPIVVQFWREVAEKAGGEASLENIVPYITSKFDIFLQNEIMRPIISQEKSSFNFRNIMDEKKILLVNLSKGRLGDINSHLLGLIIVGKILMAALSRVDSFGGKELPPFYLYIDEFQNITTDSISTILSEARKYKLSLTIAHQFIKQLDEDISNSVFGNVGSMAIFRVGSEDAEFLEKQLQPQFEAKDIMNIENYNAYLKMLIAGTPEAPFNIETLTPDEGNPLQIQNLKEMSYLKYGVEREIIEKQVMDKYKKPEIPKMPPLTENPADRL